MANNPVFNPTKRKKLEIMLKNKGTTKKQIAEELGVSRECLYYEMRRGLEVKGDYSTYKAELAQKDVEKTAVKEYNRVMGCK